MDDRMMEMLRKYPAAAELAARHGNETLHTYLGQLRHLPSEDILPSEELTEAVRDYLTPFFGAETAGECAEVLRRTRCMTTANHHHPAFEYMTVQDSILYDRWLRTQGERGTVVPILACANLNLTSTLYPRGMVIYHCAAPERRVRVPLYSWKLKRPCVAAIGGIAPEMADRAMKRLQEERQHGSITPEMTAALERFCREILLSPQVQRYDTLWQQTTVINAMLSQRYFTDRQPQYLWMPMETITARLLEKDIRKEGSLLYRMLFSGSLRAALLRELEGISGCWTGDSGGTHFFWGLDSRDILFPLRLREERGETVLAGQNSLEEDVAIPFTPEALAEGLAARTLLPGIFLCFAETHFLRDFTVFGGYYQPTYLGQMRHGLVRALRGAGGFEREAAIIESRRNAMTLGLVYLLRTQESGVYPVSAAELLERPIATAELEGRLEMTVTEALAVLRDAE